MQYCSVPEPLPGAPVLPAAGHRAIVSHGRRGCWDEDGDDKVVVGGVAAASGDDDPAHRRRRSVVVVAIFPAAPAPRRRRQIAGDGGPWRYVACRRLSASGAYSLLN